MAFSFLLTSVSQTTKVYSRMVIVITIDDCIDNDSARSSQHSKCNTMIVCELLCYITCKYNKFESVKIASIVSDFYSPEDFCQSKKTLVEAVDALGPDKWPRPPNRKPSDKNRAKNEVNDILSVFTYIIENNLTDALPKWVAVNVENLPTVSLEVSDLGCLKKMDQIDSKLEKFTATKISNTDNSTEYRPTEGYSTSTSLPGSQTGSTWADVVHTPTLTGAYGGRAETTDVDTDVQENDTERYQLVGGKRRKLRSPGQDLRPLLKTTTSQPPAKPKPKTVIGSNAVCTLKAARELKKNRIFAVSNISTDITCDMVMQWLTESDIRVNNVFLGKSRFENTNLFRVNIDANDAEKFHSSNVWGPHIIVRDWVFKAQSKD